MKRQKNCEPDTKVLKEVDPDVPVTACAGWRKYDSVYEERYNGLGLDYIGVDIYDDLGVLEPANALKAEKPMYVAEYGPEEKFDWDDDFQIRNTEAFLCNACANGYFGAFFWFYGGPNSREALTLIGRDGKPRKLAEKMPDIFKKAKELIP